MTRRLHEQVKLLDRRRRAWALCASGLTFEAIGKQLHVSGYTAWQDVYKHYGELVDRAVLDTDALRLRHQTVIDAIRAAHWKRRDREGSARIILQGLEREARLNGLDKQRSGFLTAEQVLGAFRGIVSDLLAHFTNVDDRRAIAAAFKKQIGAAIDVEPEAKTG